MSDLVRPLYDVTHGHCAIPSTTGSGFAAYMVDGGGSVSIDLVTGSLTTTEAKALGHALISWAVWREKTIPTIDHYQQTGGL